ncbi:MAG: hypothetical protein M1419_04725 [Bacteroidetes bacterium]|nr:hypothetical protein [Bacteroidota bacterium]
MDLCRALTKVDRMKLATLRLKEEKIEVITCSSVDEAYKLMQDTYYKTMMGEGWEKKFEPNVSSVQKIDIELLPEKFEVDLINVES